MTPPSNPVEGTQGKLGVAVDTAALPSSGSSPQAVSPLRAPAANAHTPGPWLYSLSGDGKRIIIGDGLLEGPGGYEIAEVYSDDCDIQTAFANARLISVAWTIPGLLEALRPLAELRLPAKCEGNAAYYSILHSQILAARAALSRATAK